VIDDRMTSPGIGAIDRAPTAKLSAFRGLTQTGQAGVWGTIMIKRTVVALAATLLAATAPAVASAQVTEPVSFTLNNNTDHVLVSLYISVVSTNDWEEDIFGDGMLDAGDSVEVTINDNLPDCEYDLKAEFSDDTSLELGSVDFCALDGGSIDVTE
jgi:hypothetical protein